MEVGKNDLDVRLFNFAVNTIKFLRTQNPSTELNVIKYQLTKSATSSGANYEEAQAGSSKLDFTNKVRISLSEMRESNYWLRILKGINEDANPELEKLIQESKELKLILGAIVQKARINNQDKR
ncbi:MAG: four helix bundle protein [Bacteroidia bacterium]|nr:four helix bundle protein [Bacteroidia bacterium]MCF8445913.1 four helix bundle protein [Bacteroidia bacterium]